ncbi:MAG: MoaD/ThiS family protein [Flavobacteriales bacterium]|nr:MoaD/ThiS family protein [Flavobacteriales bacterium]
MRIKVLFFGVLEDVTKKKEMSISDFSDTDSLLKALKNEFAELNEKTFQIAVNQTIINKNTTLNNGDTIALLPPFAGG